MRAHTTTLVGSRLFVFGGCGVKECYGELWIFDTETLYWMKPKVHGEAPPPLRAHTATLVDARHIFVFAGGDGPTYYNDLWSLDTMTLNWTKVETTGAPPSPRRAHTACCLDGKLFVFGGGDGARALNDLYALDLHNLSWEAIECYGDVPPPRGYLSGTLVGHHLVIYGGSDGKSCLSSVHMISLRLFVWTKANLVASSDPVCRLAHSASLVGSYLFVFGGHDGIKYQGGTQEALALLNLETLEWEFKEVLGKAPVGRGYHTATLYDSRLYVWGGYDGRSVFGDLAVLELGPLGYLPSVKGESFRLFDEVELDMMQRGELDQEGRPIAVDTSSPTPDPAAAAAAAATAGTTSTPTATAAATPAAAAASTTTTTPATTPAAAAAATTTTTPTTTPATTTTPTATSATTTPTTTPATTPTPSPAATTPATTATASSTQPTATAAAAPATTTTTPTATAQVPAAGSAEGSASPAADPATTAATGTEAASAAAAPAATTS